MDRTNRILHPYLTGALLKSIDILALDQEAHQSRRTPAFLCHGFEHIVYFIGKVDYAWPHFSNLLQREQTLSVSFTNFPQLAHKV